MKFADPAGRAIDQLIPLAPAARGGVPLLALPVPELARIDCLGFHRLLPFLVVAADAIPTGIAT